MGSNANYGSPKKKSKAQEKLEKQQEQAAKMYLIDLNKRFGYKKNKTVIFTVMRNYEKNKQEKQKKRMDRIMQEAFEYNSSLPELRDMNRVQLPEHIDPEEIFSNRVDLFTMNCRLQRVQHPSA